MSSSCQWNLILYFSICKIDFQKLFLRRKKCWKVKRSWSRNSEFLRPFFAESRFNKSNHEKFFLGKFKNVEKMVKVKPFERHNFPSNFPLSLFLENKFAFNLECLLTFNLKCLFKHRAKLLHTGQKQPFTVNIGKQ